MCNILYLNEALEVISVCYALGALSVCHRSALLSVSVYVVQHSRSAVASMQMSTRGEVRCSVTSHSSVVGLSSTTDCLVEMYSVSRPSGPNGALQRHRSGCMRTQGRECSRLR